MMVLIPLMLFNKLQSFGGFLHVNFTSDVKLLKHMMNFLDLLFSADNSVSRNEITNNMLVPISTLLV